MKGASMGDRGNIAVQAGPGKRVYFYTHWRGSEIRQVAQTALDRHQRWDDPAYLARIVFCELIGDDVGGETGFGISTDICDNSHPIVVLDASTQMVWFEDREGVRLDVDYAPASFEKFCKMDFGEGDHGEE